MFVELHILQNFAPSCLNRDDTNAPKDCAFGGYRRARVSSQCIKRSIRKYFAEHAEALKLDGHIGQRTKLLHERLVALLTKAGKSEEQASKLVKFALEGNGLKMDDADQRTSVLLFLDEDGIVKLKDALLSCWTDLEKAQAGAQKPASEQPEGEKGKKKTAKEQKREKAAQTPESVTKAFEGLQQPTTKAVDIALFGRMVAELENMNVDAACQVAHALSTNEAEMEMDFYTAVDDLQHPLSASQQKSKVTGEPGAGMMGMVEFNSSCFYRYALLDTAQLEKNLAGDKSLAKDAVLAFVRAAVYAIPTGKQNSMAAQNLPLYVRVVAKEGATPWSLANAFLKPVRPNKRDDTDLAQSSIQKLEDHHRCLTRMYGNGGERKSLISSHYDEKSESIESLLKKLEEVLG